MSILGIIFTVIAYFLGSLCSAVIISKVMKLGDPRTTGSKNPGATNMLRLAGKQAALMTLAGDMLKGFIPVFFARILGVDGLFLGLVALGALVGHMFPIFFEFKGGKGVATMIGGVLGFWFFAGLLAIVVWLSTAALTRYASLASLAAVGTALVLSLFHFGYFIPVAIMTGLVVWKHWENIERLQKGTEDKLGF